MSTSLIAAKHKCYNIERPHTYLKIVWDCLRFISDEIVYILPLTWNHVSDSVMLILFDIHYHHQGYPPRKWDYFINFLRNSPAPLLSGDAFLGFLSVFTPICTSNLCITTCSCVCVCVCVLRLFQKEKWLKDKLAASGFIFVAFRWKCRAILSKRSEALAQERRCGSREM